MKAVDQQSSGLAGSGGLFATLLSNVRKSQYLELVVLASFLAIKIKVAAGLLESRGSGGEGKPWKEIVCLVRFVDAVNKWLTCAMTIDSSPPVPLLLVNSGKP
jgi:hypothetical protein